MREKTLNSLQPKKRTDLRWFFEGSLYLALFLLACFLFPLILTDLLHTPYPLAAIVSNSMWPAIKAGDIVVIRGVEAKNDLKVGDVIVYDNGDGFIIHRVVSLNEKTLITKGDANGQPDDPIRYGQIIGKAIANEYGVMKIPFLGQIAMFLNNANP